MHEKVAAIAAAQRRGVVTDRFTAGQVLALVLTLANMWQLQGADFLDLVPGPDRRTTVRDAVRRLLAP
jgi:hypothetical protein